MLNVFLTKKLSTDLKLPVSNAVPIKSNPKYCWLGHILCLNHCKYIIFLNQQSLFSIIMDNKTSINIWGDFKARVQLWTGNYHIRKEIADEYLSHFSKINILKSQDKKLMGTMNDVVYHMKHEIGKHICSKMDIAEIKINGIPRKKGKDYVLPHDEFQAMFSL